MVIFSITVAILNKDFTWILVALLWADVAIMEYCDGKLLKGSEALNKSSISDAFSLNLPPHNLLFFIL